MIERESDAVDVGERLDARERQSRKVRASQERGPANILIENHWFINHEKASNLI